MRINEIFYSLQGEGRYAGYPVVFVRFAGCNLNCDFCDTTHQPYEEYSNEEILQEIKKYAPCDRVVLTGGEPTLQITEEFLDLLVENGYFINIETNGTKPLPPYCDVHWIVCSPKFEFCPKADIKLDWIDELKVVYRGAGQDMSKYDRIEATCYYLQPCDTGNIATNQRIIKEAIEFIKQNPKWNLSLQTQKILGIR